jgi:hypothetical protein
MGSAGAHAFLFGSFLDRRVVVVGGRAVAVRVVRPLVLLFRGMGRVDIETMWWAVGSKL